MVDPLSCSDVKDPGGAYRYPSVMHPHVLAFRHCLTYQVARLESFDELGSRAVAARESKPV